MRWQLGLVLSVVMGMPATAASLYTPPESCAPLATLRLSNCIVRHVSSCDGANIVDTFYEGSLVGRAFYGHPSLFERYVGTNGYRSGHDYGSGAPALGDVLEQGQRYEYTRKVLRSVGEARPGDEGVEVMRVGRLGSIEIGRRSFKARDITFEVTNDEGYRYVERALMLLDPKLTLGVSSVEYGADGKAETSFSSLPEAISLAEDPDFLGFEPAPSCLPSS